MTRGDERVVVGEVLRAHGVRGHVRVRPTGGTLARLTVGEHLDVTTAGGSYAARVAERWSGGLMRLEGVDDREAADALRGARLMVAASRLPVPSDPGEFYVRDLVGCEVLVGHRPMGRVSQVLERPANDVLEVTGDGSGSVLLPFTRDAVTHVDMVARLIVLRGDLLGDVD